MNRDQYNQWREHARQLLLNLYTETQVRVVLHWFDNIKGAGERDLVGNDEVNAMLTFAQARNSFDLYNSLMARIFIYAPLILKEDGLLDEAAIIGRVLDTNGLAQWTEHARQGLLNRYTPAQTEEVLRWFAAMKGQEELELVGNEASDCRLLFVSARNNYNMYNSYMCRLFVYAPLILRESGLLS